MNMDYNILPLKGFNRIEFGMSHEIARRGMNEEPKPFRRGNESFPSDYFNKEGLFFYYDDSGFLEAVEFAAVGKVFFNQTNLFDLTIGDATSFIRNFDPQLLVEDDGVTSRSLSLGLWSPSAYEGPNEAIESILIGRAGYYDF